MSSFLSGLFGPSNDSDLSIVGGTGVSSANSDFTDEENSFLDTGAPASGSTSATYGAYVSGSGTGAAIPSGQAPSAVVSSGDGSTASLLSGLGGLFSGLSVGIGSIIKSTQPPPPVIASPYNPYLTATGVNTSVTPIASSVGALVTSPLVLIFAAIIAFIVLRGKKTA